MAHATVEEKEERGGYNEEEKENYNTDDPEEEGEGEKKKSKNHNRYIPIHLFIVDIRAPLGARVMGVEPEADLLVLLRRKASDPRLASEETISCVRLPRREDILLIMSLPVYSTLFLFHFVRCHLARRLSDEVVVKRSHKFYIRIIVFTLTFQSSVHRQF